MSVNKREIKREKWRQRQKQTNLKVPISHVSDAFTELHEENVYLALIVCAVC